MKPIEELNITIKKDNIIDGIMKSNGLYCLVAEPKVGKSFLALQLANSLVNNKQFLGFNTNPTSVLYVSTEISELQLKERLEITGYTFKPNSFFFVQKDEQHKLCIRDDLLLDLKETLGSTGIDGNMNGILTLINNKDNTYTLKIINRDFEEQNLNLIRNNKLEFEIINEDNTELDFNLSVFMRYVIKKKEVIFTPAEMIAELNLLITPSRFGRLLNSNIKRLEKEGIYVELNRTATSRNYKAKFIDPLILEE